MPDATGTRPSARVKESFAITGRTSRALVFAAAYLIFGLIVQSRYPGDDGRRSADSSASAERPNVIFVLADDLDSRSIEHLPAL